MADTPHPPEGVHTDFTGEMSYGDYLGLDQLLAVQHPRSDNHNEMLFIIQHQTTELWMKLMLHELRAARARIRADDLQPAFKMAARVSRIMAQLIQAWDVLSTLTPSEYLDFRKSLGRVSGFQSHQYRLIEFVLGNKNATTIAPHRHRADIAAELEAELAAPSLYDEAVRLLARRGFAVTAERDFRQLHVVDPALAAAWIPVYRRPAHHWELYELGEELVDLEDYFRQWRFRHVTTVERIICGRPGTGGPAGGPHLRGPLGVPPFPPPWGLRARPLNHITLVICLGF